jgi:hypothetical protein
MLRARGLHVIITASAAVTPGDDRIATSAAA